MRRFFHAHAKHVIHYVWINILNTLRAIWYNLSHLAHVVLGVVDLAFKCSAENLQVSTENRPFSATFQHSSINGTR